jgi:hypothetical protein
MSNQWAISTGRRLLAHKSGLGWFGNPTALLAASINIEGEDKQIQRCSRFERIFLPYRKFLHASLTLLLNDMGRGGVCQSFLSKLPKNFKHSRHRIQDIEAFFSTKPSPSRISSFPSRRGGNEVPGTHGETCMLSKDNVCLDHTILVPECC